MKKLMVAFCMVSLGLSSNVYALEVKKTNINVKAVTSTVTGVASSLTPTSARGTIATINNRLINADKEVQAAFLALCNVMLSKDEVAKNKAKLAAVNGDKNLSEKEKSAKIAEIITDSSAVLNAEKEKIADEISKASEAKKEAVCSAVVDVAAASFKYLDLANDCKSLGMSIATNPTLAVTLAPELANLKDTGIILKNNLKSLKALTTQAVSISKASGLEIQLPKNKTSKVKKVNESFE